MIIDTIAEQLATGNSILLLGSGSKRRLLQAVAVAVPESLYFDELQPPKIQLIRIAKKLHKLDGLKEYDLYPEWDDVAYQIKRMDEEEIMDVVLPSLEGRILIFDNVEAATSRSIRKLLLSLLDAGIVMLIAGNDGHMGQKRRMGMIQAEGIMEIRT